MPLSITQEPAVSRTSAGQVSLARRMEGARGLVNSVAARSPVAPELARQPFPATLRTPKLRNRGADAAYRFYAGFSSDFVRDVLPCLAVDENLVLDPWCGGATTLRVCQELGLKSLGVDINPAMV